MNSCTLGERGVGVHYLSLEGGEDSGSRILGQEEEGAGAMDSWVLRTKKKKKKKASVPVSPHLCPQHLALQGEGPRQVVAHGQDPTDSG